MKVIFRGVRGSIPTPGPKTVKYGGNTTCIEIRTTADDLIILDAGTGIHALAQQLDPKQTVDAHIFITHTHWDHIQGLPFFTPLFSPENRITIYGGIDPVTGEDIQRAMSVQLQYSFFPIREAELKAKISYQTVTPGKSVTVANAKITPAILNHPVLNFGYRIECDDQILFFTGDYEPPFNIYPQQNPEHEKYQSFVDAKLADVAEAMQGLTGLIIDSSYTDEEYLLRRGWGHGTYQFALDIAAQVKPATLFLTHHEPNRSDQELDAIFEQLQEQCRNSSFNIIAAQEGVEYIL